jgi:hypothetical protein
VTKREQQTVARFKKLNARLDKMLERDAVTDKQDEGRNVTDAPGTISDAVGGHGTRRCRKPMRCLIPKLARCGKNFNASNGS